MSRIKFRIGFFLIFLFLLSFFSFIPFPSSSSNLPWNDSRVLSVIDSVYSSNFDSVNNGFFNEVNSDNSVYNDIKLLGDYNSLIDLYLQLYDFYQNDTFIFLAESLVPFLFNFNKSLGGYIGFLNSDWSLRSDSYYDFSASSQVMTTFLNLFQATGNQSYLIEALNIRNFINSYHLDLDNWGFDAILNFPSKSPNYGTWRVPSYYGLYANSLYHLFVATDNNTYLSESLWVLNQTTSVAYSDTVGNLYAYMYGLNSDSFLTEFQVHQQYIFLKALIPFLTLEIPLTEPYLSSFNHIFYQIFDKLFSYGLDYQGYFIHTFTSNGEISDATLYSTRQTGIADLLLSMVNHNLTINSTQANYLLDIPNKINIF
ncbi:MAG: hypothetical protein ACW98D_18830, partial [Promethearchaeota archaeon]